MIILLTALHLFVCVFLILVVLLQTGKGADVAAAFGGTSQTAFGARGATTLLSKLTTGSAIIFMITSFALAMLANKGGSSVVNDEAATQQSAPAARAAAGQSAAAGQPAAVRPQGGFKVNESHRVPKWWNWQTHHLEGVAPRGMRVRIPPSAPDSPGASNA
jgi:preprotein translocase subunit SecG